jgi:calcineurin-like phosphoesterase family protein
MNCAIVDRWNETVCDEDVVYVLGDVGRGKHVEIVRDLRGRKRLIAGNIDDVVDIGARRLFETISIARWLPGVVLTHIPVHTSQLRGRTINVHGHLHHATLSDPRYVCASAERIDFRPALLTRLAEFAPLNAAFHS